MRFTKALRQEIVEDFAKRNGGIYDAAAFLTEVRKQGVSHPAYEWFQWDDDKAALEFRLDQARDFARGLVVKFEVREVHRGKMKIMERSAPLILSPLERRRDGGGYFFTDPNDPEHMEELRRQAARDFRLFLRRYEAVLGFVGASMQSLERVQELLESDVEEREAA